MTDRTELLKDSRLFLYQPVTYYKCLRRGCGITTNDPFQHDRDHEKGPLL